MTVITEEMEATYRVVRRYYALQDVKGWLKDHGYDEHGKKGCKYVDIDELVRRYDKWQGDNEHWYEAIGVLAGDMGLEW